MTPEEIRQTIANIKMWLIRNYYDNLAGYFTDDPGFFGRQVVDQGKSLPSAHPAGWTQHIVNCTTDEVVEFYRSDLVPIYTQLIAWKLVAEMPEALKEGTADEQPNRD